MLVDTSVWVDHPARVELVRLLDNGEVMIHPFIDELACETSATETAADALSQSPQAVVASHEEVVTLIEQESLMGKGLGYVDMHFFGFQHTGRLSALDEG